MKWASVDDEWRDCRLSAGDRIWAFPISTGRWKISASTSPPGGAEVVFGGGGRGGDFPMGGWVVAELDR